LATHWQREWNTGFARPGKETFAGWIASLAQSGSTSLDHRNLGRLPESKDILKCAFPGLTEEQATYFVDAASDNPRHISEIILLLQRKPQWFENKDFSRPLTQRWKENVPRESLGLVTLERERFDAVEDAIKQLLGTASQQGDRFLRAFTLEVAEKLGFAGATSHSAENPAEDPLQPAENPHALAETLDAASMEFRSRTVRQSASDYLAELKDPESFPKPSPPAPVNGSNPDAWPASRSISNFPCSITPGAARR
jgi:hypothetical protein